MNNNFIGTWLFTKIENYDLNPSDLGVIRFDAEGRGEFEFDVNYGAMSCGHGQNIVHFGWEGNSECDPAHGTGWAELDENNLNEITGCIEFFQGDEFEFTAVKHGTKNS
ncbi:MAG TPA: hypothetical protein PK513_08770 [Alphaproteobacteria bacterium]|nr:hypothetical protein [Alphaproteobacteria bacterium]USO05498.1 MAG: hypothetical protein H6859_10270 [Rhodospirillales bacterium]HOO82582.1 hypothetical protein [Alphaproteobacteria bacterium]